MPDSTQFTEPPSRGGDALLALMSGATIVATAGIAGFCVIASWWLLPVVLFAIIGMAVVVTAALARLMSEGELPAPRLPERAASEPVPMPSPQPVLGR
jgi:hypothetical protein